MKTILLATDFSSTASNAAKYAADMASAINADLLLLHVYQMPVVYYEIPVAMTESKMIEDAENGVNQLREELLQRTGGKVTIQTEIKMGNFFNELKAVCEKIKPYSVVMGSQGTTAADRILFGGHTVYAMKHLMWPLITVPPNATFSAVKKIGLACDFEKVVDTMPVDEIKRLVNDFQAELQVLNTGKKDKVHPDMVFESGLLQEMLIDLKPAYQLMTGENTDDNIMDFAEKNQIDLLIVLPKRHGLLDKLIHKSHTKNLVLHSHVPVMALHQ